MATNGLPPRASANTHSLSQRYLSTRGEDNDVGIHATHPVAQVLRF